MAKLWVSSAAAEALLELTLLDLMPNSEFYGIPELKPVKGLKARACDCGAEKHGFMAHVRGCPKGE